MFSSTSTSIESVSAMQMAQSGRNERQITQSCAFSTVAEVLWLYLLCPCQPLLLRDCFDKRAQRGFMCLFQSYCQCKHCLPCKDTIWAQRKTVLTKKHWMWDDVLILWGKFYDAKTRRDLMDLFKTKSLFLNLTAIILVLSTSVPVPAGSGSTLSLCLLVWCKFLFIEPRGIKEASSTTKMHLPKHKCLTLTLIRA